MAKLRHNYDFSLFEKITNVEFGKLYNISTEAARLLRRKYSPNTIRLGTIINTIRIKTKANEKIKSDVLTFISQNKNKIIKLEDFHKKYGHRSTVKLRDILRISKAEKININLIRDYYKKEEHGTKCHKKKCDCEIGKLANCIKQHFFRLKHPIKASAISKLAHVYLLKYSKTDNKREFYKYLDKKYFKKAKNRNLKLAESQN